MRIFAGAYCHFVTMSLSRIEGTCEKAGISAENRGNWRAEFWNRTKNVVPLHCQNEGEKWRAS